MQWIQSLILNRKPFDSAFKEEKLNEAARCFNEAYNKNKDNKNLIILLGNVYEKLGDYKKAIKYFD